MHKPITKDDILAVWSGIRPLVREMNVKSGWCFRSKKGTVDTKRISRTHEIWQKGDGFITIAGGKWTTVRNMAEDLCDSIERSTSLPVRFSIPHSPSDRKVSDQKLQVCRRERVGRSAGARFETRTLFRAADRCAT